MEDGGGEKKGPQTTRWLVALAIGLGVTLLVVLLVSVNDGDEGGPSATSFGYGLLAMILVTATSWRMLRSVTVPAFFRNVAIWLAIGLAGWGLYYVLYPNG
jgi:hypothetical protein